jgi:Rps23 Pro-64 3,4-dihydroxylase Tpa1-like proline 4-hydroxylase
MIDYSLSEKLKVNYQIAKPFPYIVIDNFLPNFFLEKCTEEILKHDIWHYDTIEWTEEFQQNKFYYPSVNTDMQEFKTKLPNTTLIMDYLNSDDFLKFLTNLTGYRKVYRDPVLMGGGIHKIKKGGKLSVHIDYNEHPENKNKRVLNLLIYLNKNWKSEWNGNLEFWSKDRTQKEIEIEPIFNRAVIFDIEDAPHGHPIPLNTPEDVDRFSLALYYFTDDKVEPEKKHTVIFYKDYELGNKTQNLEDLFK